MKTNPIAVNEVPNPRAAVLLLQSSLSITLMGAPAGLYVFYSAHGRAASVGVLLKPSGERTVWEMVGGHKSDRKARAKAVRATLAAFYAGLGHKLEGVDE